jgi:hypothetical protein
MGRDIKGVAVVSMIFGLFAVVASGTPSGIMFMCLFVGAAICLFRER